MLVDRWNGVVGFMVFFRVCVFVSKYVWNIQEKIILPQFPIYFRSISHTRAEMGHIQVVKLNLGLIPNSVWRFADYIP